MFKIIVLSLFLLIMYTVLRREKRTTRISILAYFSLISIVFMAGIFRIAIKYDLYDGPVLDGGFESLSDWVGLFSFLYIIPTTFIMAYVLYRLARRIFNHTWLRTIIYLIGLVLILGIGYVSLFIFVLIFYGFAP